MSVLSVSACGAVTPEDVAELDASFACMERAGTVFPGFAQMSDRSEEESAETSSDFHVEAAGGFAWTWKVKGKNRPLSDEFECRGNSTDRTIESVQLNGVTKRANPSEIWKF